MANANGLHVKERSVVGGTVPPRCFLGRGIPNFSLLHVVILLGKIGGVVTGLTQVTGKELKVVRELGKHLFAVELETGSGSKDAAHECCASNGTHGCARKSVIKDEALLGQSLNGRRLR